MHACGVQSGSTLLVPAQSLAMAMAVAMSNGTTHFSGSRYTLDHMSLFDDVL